MRNDYSIFRGIAVGAAAFVLFANVLNTLYGWGISAVFAGMFAGLELGFLSWSPKGSMRCHTRVYREVLVKRIGRPVGRFLLAVLIFLSYLAAGIGAVEWCSYLGMKHWPLLSRIPSVELFKNAEASWLGSVLIFLVALLVQHQAVSETCYDDYGQIRKQPWHKELAIRMAILGVNVLLAPLAGPLLSVAFGLFIAYMLTVLLIYVPMLAMLELSRSQRLVPVGVISGGLCGLAYGWTGMQPTLTALAVMTAAAAGCLAAAGFKKLFATDRFFAAVKAFSHIVPLAEGPRWKSKHGK